MCGVVGASAVVINPTVLVSSSREYSRQKPPGDRGKLLKDYRKRRHAIWEVKMIRRKAEKQAAVERLGTEDVVWHEGQYITTEQLREINKSFMQAFEVPQLKNDVVKQGDQ